MRVWGRCIKLGSMAGERVLVWRSCEEAARCAREEEAQRRSGAAPPRAAPPPLSLPPCLSLPLRTLQRHGFWYVPNSTQANILDWQVGGGGLRLQTAVCPAQQLRRGMRAGAAIGQR